MIMAASDIISHHPEPTIEQVQRGLAGNLCRCTGYTQIVDSILHAAKEMNHGN
jgi:carbon-monoxide dehydrogenase small subunit